MKQSVLASKCGWCGEKVPGVRHMKIKQGVGEPFALCHKTVDTSCAAEWRKRAKAIAAKICEISGVSCVEIKELVSRIKKENFHDQIAMLLKELSDIIRKKADLLKAVLGEKYSQLRGEFYFLMTNILNHPKAEAYI